MATGSEPLTMRIVNAMFGRGLGGIEQCFLDYCQAIAGQGHEVIAFIHPAASVRPALEQLKGVKIEAVANLGEWDRMARYRLSRLLKKHQPDAAILNGIRAMELMRDGVQSIGCKSIGVTHNYKHAMQAGLDAFFATTLDLRRTLVEEGQPENSVHVIPNMIHLADVKREPHKRGTVPVIGAMGRFVAKKGFVHYLEALAELKHRGVDFTARIGGDGEEGGALKAHAARLGLNDRLEFMGWVKDKSAFFNGLDVFCLPSLHEPFGIVLLEAFAHGLAVVTTDSEGASEIAHHEKDALIVPKGDALAMADAIERIIHDAALAGKLAAEAERTVTGYDLAAVGKHLSDALRQVVNQDA